MSIIIQAISAVLAGSILAYLAANGRRTRSTSSYMLCVFLLLIWHIAEIGLITAKDPVQEMIALKVKFIPWCISESAGFISALLGDSAG